jgi:hypothetical protein
MEVREELRYALSLTTEAGQQNQSPAPVLHITGQTVFA